MTRAILILGPANVGKSTLFEKLTGVKTVRFNRPGVTVETISAKVNEDTILVDSPGIITSGGIDVERLKKIALSGNVYGAIFVIDATNIAAHLTLFLAAALVFRRIVLVVNMYDVAQKQGIEISAECLSKRLGVPVILASARKGIGIEEIRKILMRKDRDRNPYVKEYDSIDELFKELENPELYRELSIIAQDIARNCTKIRKKHAPVREFVDYVFLNPITGLPLTVLLLSITLRLSLLISDPIGELIEGVMTGNQVIEIIGAVFSIFPLVLTYTFFLTILEDTGLLSRIMLMLHDLVRKLGINGRLVAPLFLALGCNVPSVMLTRGAESEVQRRVAAMAIPFVPCSARMAVIAYLAYNYAQNKFLVIFTAYTFAFAAAIFTLRLFSRIRKVRSGYLAITLGPYTLPDPKVIGRRLRDVGKEFIVKVGVFVTIAALIYVYLIQPYILQISRYLAPIIGRPEAFVEAAVMGFIAKEIIIGVLSTYSVSPSMPQVLSFAVFVTLYTPCVGTFAAIGTEIGRRYAILSVLRSLFIATVSALVILFITSLRVFVA